MLNERDYEAILRFSLCFTVGLSLMTTYCFYADQVTNRFASLGDSLYQLEWYRFPTKVQKDLQIVLALCNETIYIEGYFNARFSRPKLQAVRILFQMIFEQQLSLTLVSYLGIEFNILLFYNSPEFLSDIGIFHLKSK